PSVYKLYLNFYSIGLKNPTSELINLSSISPQDTFFLSHQTNYCELNYTLKACPVDQKKKHIIRVFYGLNVTYTFKNKKAEKRYAKKLLKQGYETFYDDGNPNTNIEKQEVLISFHDKETHKRLKKSTLCDEYLFCKKHKLIFQ